ncbi:MAG TPA: hypothetical protein VFS20_30265 [Longimicrobium sp.]|nr:hypothetical protein [Longimicrobium sp.]
MSDNTLNVLLVEDDEVDVMNVQRAFRKNNIANPLFVAATARKRWRCCGAARCRPSGGWCCWT